MDSDDEFMDQGSGPESREMSVTPEPQGMAKRTRSKHPETTLKNPSGGYAWEDEYQRTWDIVKDDGDESHSLESLVQSMIESRKKKIMKNPSTPFQRGIIRTLVVVIDGSSTMLDKDLRPTRFACTLSYLQEFVVEFFDQNPIAQLGLVMMRNGVASVVSEVSGSPQHHVDKIRALKARQHNRFEPKGDPSLQNALELSRSLLNSNLGPAQTASKSSKEILIIFGALFTSDPGDIHKTIADLAREEVKVKVIGLSAQVAICQEIVQKTNFQSSANVRADAGLARFYGVIMHETHFKELLMDCVEPLAVTKSSAEAVHEEKDGVPLIRMGFPSRHSGSSSAANFPHLCACHPTLDSTDSKEAVSVQTAASSSAKSASQAGYICPQCRSKVCSLPSVCAVCGLMLILSTHLARSYHHLVPLAAYTDVPVADSYESSHCYGCLLRFPEGVAEIGAQTESNRGSTVGAKVGAKAGAKVGDKGPPKAATSSRFRCGKCRHDFCIDCDVFVHEFLHNCPGCENMV